jgi:hypothetical protein
MYAAFIDPFRQGLVALNMAITPVLNTSMVFSGTGTLKE